MTTSDWAEPEDFGLWGNYEPLIDSPDDLPLEAAPHLSPPSSPSSASTSVPSSAGCIPCALTGGGGSGVSGVRGASEDSILQERIETMRKWFVVGETQLGSIHSDAEPDAAAAMPLEELSRVAGKTIVQISDTGSPLVQQYMLENQ